MTDEYPLIGLTGFDRDVLTILATNEDQNGIELVTLLEEAYDQEIARPRFYPSMNKMAERGLIEKQAVNGRENAYRLTPEGKASLRGDLAWRKRLLDSSES